jgi:hypothetical protein
MIGTRFIFAELIANYEPGLVPESVGKNDSIFDNGADPLKLHRNFVV